MAEPLDLPELPIPRAPNPNYAEEKEDTKLIDGLFKGADKDKAKRVIRKPLLKKIGKTKKRVSRKIKRTRIPKRIKIKRKKIVKKRNAAVRKRTKKIGKSKPLKVHRIKRVLKNKTKTFFMAKKIPKLTLLKKALVEQTFLKKAPSFSKKKNKKKREHLLKKKTVEKRQYKIPEENYNKLEQKEKKTLRTRLKNAVKQGILRGRIANHVDNALRLLRANKIDRAKVEYSKGLIAYFNMPEHEEEYYLKLKSLLKKIERKELMPNHDFHHHSHALMNLKRSGRRISQETVRAVYGWKKSLESQSGLAIPQIRDSYDMENFDAEKNQESSLPAVQISPVDKKLEVRKEYEKVALSEEQSERMNKIQKLKKEKEKLKKEMDELNQ